MKDYVKYTVVTLLYLSFVLLVFGCGQSSPLEKFVNHLDKIVSILEQNDDDTEKAASEAEKYLNDNLDEISQLVSKINSPEEIKKIKEGLENTDFVFLLSSIIDRISVLEKKNPALMQDSRIIKALQPLNDLFRK